MSSVVLLKDAMEPAVFGGKAANLAALLEARIPVPDGVAVGLDAFDKDGSLLQSAKDKIRGSIRNSKLYAVRSSATVEDSEASSWAGQFETYLEVGGKDVIKKVEQCHQGATKRAKSYAEAVSEEAALQVAVVVQEMIDPEYAGVLFTRNPITGGDEFVLEYVKGLGEKLVSGEADPESIIWKPGEQVAAPFDIQRLTELAQKAEKHFNTPQDIEWVFANDTVWLTQARPITTL